MVKLDNSEPQEDLRAQESIPLFLQGQQRPDVRQKHLLCGWFVYYYFRSFSASSKRSHRHCKTPLSMIFTFIWTTLKCLLGFSSELSLTSGWQLLLRKYFRFLKAQSQSMKKKRPVPNRRSNGSKVYCWSLCPPTKRVCLSFIPTYHFQIRLE